MASTSSTTVSPSKISNSCSSVPAFLTENVTEPAGTVIVAGVNEYSLASTAMTPDGAAVAGALLPPWLPHAAIAPAAPSATVTRRARVDLDMRLLLIGRWSPCVRWSGRDGGPPNKGPVDDEQEQDRHEVHHVADQLQRGRSGPVAEQPAQDASDRAVVGQDPVQVERCAGVGEQAGLAELGDGKCHQSGRHEDQDGPRHGEEPPEVDPDARRED